MLRTLLCSTPVASGFTGGLHREVVARLREHLDLELEWPTGPAEARSISAAAAAEGFDLVIAMGGDGVVHHLANGLGGTDTALGIIPAGTTNVLARIMGIPGRPLAATEFICSLPRAEQVPAAMLTLDHGQSGVESRLATFSCGVGLDAAVVERAEQEPHRKYRFPGLHFARTALTLTRNDFSKRPPELEVGTRLRSSRAVAVLVSLYDRYSYFGRLPIRFGTHQPGTLSLLIVRKLPTRRLWPVLYRLATGTRIGNVKGLEVWNGVSSLEVTVPNGSLAQADGELLGTPARFSVAARVDHLRVMKPG